MSYKILSIYLVYRGDADLPFLLKMLRKQFIFKQIIFNIYMYYILYVTNKLLNMVGQESNKTTGVK